MVRLDVERGRHLALLGALAHQARIAAAAERQREGIEQDRLAGAGLAGEHRQPGRIVDVEPVDQHDVADGKTGEHAVFRSFPGMHERRMSPESINTKSAALKQPRVTSNRVVARAEFIGAPRIARRCGAPE